MSCEAYGPSGRRCVRRPCHPGRHAWVAEPPISRTFEELETELLRREMLAALTGLHRALARELEWQAELERKQGIRMTRAVLDDLRDALRRKLAVEVADWRARLRSSPGARLEPLAVLTSRREALVWALASLLEGR